MSSTARDGLARFASSPVGYVGEMSEPRRWVVLPSRTPRPRGPLFLALAAMALAVVGAVFALQGSTSQALTCVLIALAGVTLSLVWGLRRRS